ncbi:hypothetical protein ATERTT37_006974 [Aspergillus terreus]
MTTPSRGRTMISDYSSLIIWDTGEYEILPYESQDVPPETDDSRSDISSDVSAALDDRTDSEKLRHAFHNHLVRLFIIAA